MAHCVRAHAGFFTAILKIPWNSERNGLINLFIFDFEPFREMYFMTFIKKIDPRDSSIGAFIHLFIQFHYSCTAVVGERYELMR